jgi:GT2 family glycosyltransferase
LAGKVVLDKYSIKIGAGISEPLSQIMKEADGYSQNNSEINLPDVSLLICSRNRPQMLWETIQSILVGEEIPAEMVIVDQSDAPDPALSTYKPQQDCVFRYLWSERKGVSLGRNMAASAASHSILVFTDDDMLVTPSWLGSLARALVVAGPQCMVTGRVLISEEDDHGYAPSSRSDEQKVTYRGRVQRDVLFTNNMALYRSAFESIGGFDTRLGPGTRYPAAEDNDLAFRLLEAGYCIIYDPQPTLYHRAWRSEREFLRLQWNYGYGQGAFYAKYFSLKDTFTIRRMTNDVWAYLARFPIRVFRRRNQAYQDALFVAGMLYGALRWSITSLKNQS